MLLYCLEDLESSQSQPQAQIASDEWDHSGDLGLDNLLLLYLYPGAVFCVNFLYLFTPVLTDLLGSDSVWYLTLFLDTVLYMNIVCNINIVIQPLSSSIFIHNSFSWNSLNLWDLIWALSREQRTHLDIGVGAGREAASLLPQQEFFTAARRFLQCGEISGDLLQSVPCPEWSVVLATAPLETPGDLGPVTPGVSLLTSVLPAPQTLLLRGRDSLAGKQIISYNANTTLWPHCALQGTSPDLNTRFTSQLDSVFIYMYIVFFFKSWVCTYRYHILCNALTWVLFGKHIQRSRRRRLREKSFSVHHSECLARRDIWRWMRLCRVFQFAVLSYSVFPVYCQF